MRLGGRLAAAIEVIDDIERRHRPAADALKDWGLSHRFAGAGDRAAIGNIVYDALRRRRSAGWLFDEETARAQAIGALLLEWGMSTGAVNAELDGDRFAPPLLDKSEIETVRVRSDTEAPPAIRGDCPDWCAGHVERTFGAEWAAECAALSQRPPLDLRVNRLKSEQGRVLAALTGCGAQPATIAPGGVRIPPIRGGGRHPNVQAEAAFQKGWFEVQDEGSQIVSCLAASAEPTQILDYCAGAGGKTLALSAELANRGQIFAFDSQKARLAPIYDRLKRAGSRNVQVVADKSTLEGLAGTFDLVLVDAPCTGSGTWRRRPDAKWRLSGRQLDARVAEQRFILDEARRFVKPGGRLAYITCSVFNEENGEQIAAFLDRHPDFRPCDHIALWNGLFAAQSGLARIESRLGITLSPARTGTDGFFFSALDRQS